MKIKNNNEPTDYTQIRNIISVPFTENEYAKNYLDERKKHGDIIKCRILQNLTSSIKQNNKIVDNETDEISIVLNPLNYFIPEIEKEVEKELPKQLNLQQVGSQHYIETHNNKCISFLPKIVQIGTTESVDNILLYDLYTTIPKQSNDYRAGNTIEIQSVDYNNYNIKYLKESYSFNNILSILSHIKDRNLLNILMHNLSNYQLDKHQPHFHHLSFPLIANNNTRSAQFQITAFGIFDCYRQRKIINFIPRKMIKTFDKSTKCSNNTYDFTSNNKLIGFETYAGSGYMNTGSNNPKKMMFPDDNYDEIIAPEIPTYLYQKKNLMTRVDVQKKNKNKKSTFCIEYKNMLENCFLEYKRSVEFLENIQNPMDSYLKLCNLDYINGTPILLANYKKNRDFLCYSIQMTDLFSETDMINIKKQIKQLQPIKDYFNNLLIITNTSKFQLYINDYYKIREITSQINNYMGVITNSIGVFTLKQNPHNYEYKHPFLSKLYQEHANDNRLYHLTTEFENSTNDITIGDYLNTQVFTKTVQHYISYILQIISNIENYWNYCIEQNKYYFFLHNEIDNNQLEVNEKTFTELKDHMKLLININDTNESILNDFVDTIKTHSLHVMDKIKNQKNNISSLIIKENSETTKIIRNICTIDDYNLSNSKITYIEKFMYNYSIRNSKHIQNILFDILENEELSYLNTVYDITYTVNVPSHKYRVSLHNSRKIFINNVTHSELVRLVNMGSNINTWVNLYDNNSDPTKVKPHDINIQKIIEDDIFIFKDTIIPLDTDENKNDGDEIDE